MKVSERMNTNSMKTGTGHESNRRFSRSTSRVRQSGNFRTSRHHRLDRIMKNLYEILDRYGRRLCYQVGTGSADAVRTARVYYGHQGAFRAVLVRGEA